MGLLRGKWHLDVTHDSVRTVLVSSQACLDVSVEHSSNSVGVR